MSKAFNPESPIMKALARVFDLILLNAIFIITSIPIITIGASYTAMHYVLIRMARNEESYILKSYFKAFKQNFVQATVLWGLMLLFGGIVYADYHFMSKLPVDSQRIFKLLLGVIVMLFTCCAVYAFPLLARFENTIFGLIKNSLVVSIVFFVRTIAMVVIIAGFGFAYYNLPLRAVPILLLFGFSLPGILMAYIYTPILKQMETQSLEEEI